MSQSRTIHRKTSRLSASGAQDRIASTRDVTIYFREDCRTLQDSLQLELVVAQYWLRIRDVETPEGVPVGDAVGFGVVARLEAERDALSHAILRGLAHLGSGAIAERSGQAAARLAAAGVGLPSKFADVAEAKAVGAWRTSEGAFAGECCLFAEFEHPLGRRHSAMVFVDPRKGGVAKHVGLIGPMRELSRDAPFRPESMERLALPRAGRLLRDLLERRYGPRAANTDDYQVPIIAVRARSMESDGGSPAAGPGVTPPAAAGSPPGRSTRSRR